MDKLGKIYIHRVKRHKKDYYLCLLICLLKFCQLLQATKFKKIFLKNAACSNVNYFLLKADAKTFIIIFMAFLIHNNLRLWGCS